MSTHTITVKLDEYERFDRIELEAAHVVAKYAGWAKEHALEYVEARATVEVTIIRTEERKRGRGVTQIPIFSGVLTIAI